MTRDISSRIRVSQLLHFDCTSRHDSTVTLDILYLALYVIRIKLVATFEQAARTKPCVCNTLPVQSNDLYRLVYPLDSAFNYKILFSHCNFKCVRKHLEVLYSIRETRALASRNESTVRGPTKYSSVETFHSIRQRTCTHC